MKKNTKTKKTTKRPKKIVAKSNIVAGKLLCINNTENETLYWMGSECANSKPHDDKHIIKYVCPDCVTNLLPLIQQSEITSMGMK